MSYTLHVWEEPIPANMTEAGHILSRLSAENCPQNPKFIALAQQLTTRYACLSTVGADDETVWSDGPLDGRAARPVYGIGLQSHAVAEALPFVVQAARQVGLVLLDMQAGTVYRPDGSTLGAPPPAAPSEPPPLTRHWVTQSLVLCVAPILLPMGFAANERQPGFERHLSELSQSVRFFVETRWNGFAVNVKFQVSPAMPPQLRALADRYHGTSSLFLPRVVAATGITARRFDSTGFLDAQVDDAGALEALTTDLRQVTERAAPVFAECTTLKSLHHQLNEVPLAESLFFHGNMHQIVAASFGLDVLEQTHARLLAQTPTGRHERLRTIRSQIIDALSAAG